MSRTELLDEGRVDKLRKDFLLLLKNVPHVIESIRDYDYSTYAEFRGVVEKYAAALYKTILQDYAKGSLEKDESVSDSDRDFLKKKLFETAGRFYSVLRELPWERPHRNDIEAWDKKVRRAAPVAWKGINYVIQWYESTRKRPVTLQTSDRLVLEGFQTEVIGYNEADEYHREGIAGLREALKTYRRQALQVVPWLIKHQLPLSIDFNVGVISDRVGEHRGGKDIFINPYAVSGESVKNVVKTLAHEMTHYLYKHLGAGEEAFWNAAIRQDYGPLDLEELLSKWPPSESYALGFVEAMATKDPTLALQVDVLGHGHDDVTYMKRSDFERALADGKTTLRVPQTPITGYAGRNPEEALCEAVGLLVAYGPRAVHEKIRHWLGIVIPGKVKTASLTQRVARRYLAAS
jgi:hypothetical protein